MPKKQDYKSDDTTKKKDSKDEMLEKVIKHFDASWEYTSGSWHDRWTNNNKLYNNVRVKRAYFGVSDTFVPMTFGTIETLTSALFGYKPKFNFMAPRQKQDQKTDILNSLVDFYWEKDQWSIKVINTGRSMLKLGTGIDYFCWAGDHPVMINVPLRDFFIDPTASSLENARYMGRRYLTTLDELKEFEVVDLDGKPDDDGNYPMKKKYTIPDDVDVSTNSSGVSGQKGSTDKPTDKEEKDMFYGSTLKDTDGQVEVIEYWTEDKVCTVMNRKHMIEDCENYFKAKDRENGSEYPSGLMPFAASRDYVDESLFYAKGEIDFIADLQEDLNDSKNQRKDALSDIINQMYTLDPKYGDQIETVENLQGAVYPFEAGALVPIVKRNLPPDAFSDEMNTKNEIREATASNEVVKGAPQTSGGKATATEINAQIAGAGQRINLKITQIENEYFHRVSLIVLQMVRRYVTEPMMVRIVGKDGARWEEFDPADFNEGDYEPRVQLDIAVKSQKEEQGAKAKEMLAAFLNDPDVNQIELKKTVLAKGFELDPDEVEVLMTPPEAMGDPMAGDPAMMPPDPMMAGMPPEGMMPPMGDTMLPPELAAMPPPPMPEQQPTPQTIIDPETGEEFYIDPVTGEAIPVSMLMQ